MRKYVALIDHEDEKAVEEALRLTHYEKKYDLIRYALRKAFENLPEFISFSVQRKRKKNNGVTTPLYAGFNGWEEQTFLEILKKVNQIRKTTKSDLLKDIIYFVLEQYKGGIQMGELERLFFSEEVGIYPFPYVEGVPELRVSIDPSEKGKFKQVKEELEKNGMVGVKATLKIPDDPTAKRFAELLVTNLNGRKEVKGTLYVTTRKGWGSFSLEKENPTVFFAELFPQS